MNLLKRSMIKVVSPNGPHRPLEQVDLSACSQNFTCRAVGRSENAGVPVLFGGHNLTPTPLVDIGLTDLPKSGGAMAPTAPPGTTGLT